MLSVREFIGDSVELYSLPDVYIRLNAVLEDPNSAAIDMADVIQYDPALSARVLRIVNSAFFGLPSKIDTVRNAVTMLGTLKIHDIALATSVIEAFDGMPVDLIDMYNFWSESIHCGVTSQLLANKCNILDSEKLFVAGMLSDIGHLLMYQKIPEQCAYLLAKVNSENLVLFKEERSLLGFDYATLGAELLRHWNLPESLQLITQNHVEPWLGESFHIETAIVHIARIINSFEITDDNAEEVFGRVDQSAFHLTGLNIELLRQVRLESEQILADTVKLFISARGGKS